MKKKQRIILFAVLTLVLALAGCGDKNTVKIAGVKTTRDATSLDLRRAELSQKDLETLASLQNLEELDLYRSNITDLTPLAGLKNLTILELTAESAKDVTPLLGMTKLEDLSLCGEEENLDELAVLTNLKKLTFYSHGVVDNDAVEKVQAAIPGLVVDYPGQWGV